MVAVGDPPADADSKSCTCGERDRGEFQRAVGGDEVKEVSAGIRRIGSQHDSKRTSKNDSVVAERHESGDHEQHHDEAVQPDRTIVDDVEVRHEVVFAPRPSVKVFEVGLH